MGLAGKDGLLAAADTALAAPERDLLGRLVEFVAQRLDAAEELQRFIAHTPHEAFPDLERRLHAFLRECWDALDGIGRLVNVCLYRQFPDIGLHRPDHMTRQCTFYTVRRALSAHPAAARHPVSEWLSAQTRLRPGPAYERLSFLYNLTLFVPLPLGPDGSLPGWNEVPPEVRSLVRSCSVKPCSAAEGAAEILGWLSEFAGQCCLLLQRSLEEPAMR